MVIDNSAGLIPVPASEIEISRTVFRSGESEYRLGGRPVRLMDIQELLSDTGMGRALHTIVGQGQLDAVLSARPEERPPVHRGGRRHRQAPPPAGARRAQADRPGGRPPPPAGPGGGASPAAQAAQAAGRAGRPPRDADRRGRRSRREAGRGPAARAATPTGSAARPAWVQVEVARREAERPPGRPRRPDRSAGGDRAPGRALAARGGGGARRRRRGQVRGASPLRVGHPGGVAGPRAPGAAPRTGPGGCSPLEDELRADRGRAGRGAGHAGGRGSGTWRRPRPRSDAAESAAGRRGRAPAGRDRGGPPGGRRPGAAYGAGRPGGGAGAAGRRAGRPARPRGWDRRPRRRAGQSEIERLDAEASAPSDERRTLEDERSGLAAAVAELGRRNRDCWPDRRSWTPGGRAGGISRRGVRQAEGRPADRPAPRPDRVPRPTCVPRSRAALGPFARRGRVRRPGTMPLPMPRPGRARGRDAGGGGGPAGDAPGASTASARCSGRSGRTLGSGGLAGLLLGEMYLVSNLAEARAKHGSTRTRRS